MFSWSFGWQDESQTYRCYSYKHHSRDHHVIQLGSSLTQIKITLSLALKSQPWRTSLGKEDHRTLFKALLPVHKNAKARLQIEHLN